MCRYKNRDTASSMIYPVSSDGKCKVKRAFHFEAKMPLLYSNAYTQYEIEDFA